MLKLLGLYLAAAIVATVVAWLTAVTWYQALIFWFVAAVVWYLIEDAESGRGTNAVILAIVCILVWLAHAPNEFIWNGLCGLLSPVGGIGFAWFAARQYDRWEEEDDERGWPPA